MSMVANAISVLTDNQGMMSMIFSLGKAFHVTIITGTTFDTLLYEAETVSMYFCKELCYVNTCVI